MVRSSTLTGSDRKLRVPATVSHLCSADLLTGRLSSSKGPFVYSPKAPEVTQRLWKETMEELAFADVQTIVQKLSVR